MNRDGHNGVAFFVGPEVENTPAYSKKTLFVVGKQDVATIERLARQHKTPHVFMGANHSFNVDSTDGTFYWRVTFSTLLDKGFWVTLDYPAHQHESVLKMFTAGVWQSRLFVPLLSVRIPQIQTSSPNLTIKIDDIDFKATNPGVWCMHFHEVTDSNRFTDWQDYGTDLVLTEDQVAPHVGPAHTLPLRVKAPEVVAPAKVLERSVLHVEVEGDVTPEQVQAVVQNFTELGLDTEGKSKLKADPDAPQETTNTIVESPAAAAEAYAEGAKEDPLGKTAPKKPKVTKKVEV